MKRSLRAISLVGLCAVIGVSLAISLPRDFIGDIAVFVSAGRLASLGLNPYGISAITPYSDTGTAFINLSPPLSVLFFQPIAWIDPPLLLRISYGLSLLVYIAILFVFHRAYPRQISLLKDVWALAIFPLWLTLGFGQVYVLLLVAATVAWLALRSGHDDLAGLALGFLIAWKPNYLLWPLFLFLTGRRRAGLVSAATAGLLSNLPVLVYGPMIYVEWIKASIQTSASIGGLGIVSFIAQDLGVAWVTVPVSICIILSAVIWVWRVKPEWQRTSEVALVIALLVLPITNMGYLLLLVPVFFSRPWTKPIVAAAVILMPDWGLLLNHATVGGEFGAFWPYPFAFALLLAYPIISGKVRIRDARLAIVIPSG